MIKRKKKLNQKKKPAFVSSLLTRDETTLKMTHLLCKALTGYTQTYVSCNFTSVLFIAYFVDNNVYPE